MEERIAEQIVFKSGVKAEGMID